MNVWAIAWVILLTTFISLEVAGLVNPAANDTLSEIVWKIAGNPYGKFFLWHLTAFQLWLIVHFITKGKV
jgi:hypothetical protein